MIGTVARSTAPLRGRPAEATALLEAPVPKDRRVACGYAMGPSRKERIVMRRFVLVSLVVAILGVFGGSAHAKLLHPFQPPSLKKMTKEPICKPHKKAPGESCIGKHCDKQPCNCPRH
jgi:hypothetical protein